MPLVISSFSLSSGNAAEYNTLGQIGSALSVNNGIPLNATLGDNAAVHTIDIVGTPPFFLPTDRDPNIDKNICETYSNLFIAGPSQFYPGSPMDSLILDGNGKVIGDMNHVHDSHTGISRAIGNQGKLEIRNVTFMNCFSSGDFQTKGGAAYNDSQQSGFFRISNSAFQGNHLMLKGSNASFGAGGALFNGNSQANDPTQGSTATISDTKFSGNFVSVTNENNASSNATQSIGGAIANSGYSSLILTGTNLLDSNRRIEFSNNYVSVSSVITSSDAQGGAIHNEGLLRIENALFLENMAINNIPTTMASNADYASGGAIYHNGYPGTFNDIDTTLTLVNCDFIANSASGNGINTGGAIYHNNIAEGPRGGKTSTIIDSNFERNTVSSGLSSKGGAIYHDGIGSIRFLSVNRDVVYQNNFVNADNEALRRANAITFDGGYKLSGTEGETVGMGKPMPNPGFESFWIDMDFTAANSRSISFYDTVDFTQSSWTKFHFNRTVNNTEGLGTITFSGKNFQGDDAQSVASRTSVGNLYTNFVQDNGTVRITDKAIVGAKEAKPYAPGQYEIGAQSYTFNKGTFELSKGGHLIVSNFNVNGASWQDTTLIINDRTSSLTANTIDISKGARIDLGIQGNVNGWQTPSGWQVTASSVKLGGTIGISDNLLDYYMDPIFEHSQHFLVFKGLNQNAEYTGEFDQIISEQHGKSLVTDFNNGTWSYQVKTNADGTKDLYAIWTTDAGYDPEDPGMENPSPEPGDKPKPEIKPELAGDLPMNTLWTTDSNLRSMTDIALGQIGLDRYRLKNCTNYWVTGLGDFDMARNSGRRDGYDYNGGGYAVGGDARFCPKNYILGLAFGNMYGKTKSRDFNAEVKQTTYIGMLYGGWLEELDKENSLNLTFSVAYGWTRNKMRTFYSDGMRSNGKWNNNGWRFTLREEWLHDLGNNWTLNPFIGAEYDDITSKAFTEEGDRPRRFEKGKMRNLALPIGSGISKQMTFNNGYVWINSFEASYLPDVYRSNPQGRATRQTADRYSWIAKGSQMSRHAGRFEYSTRLIFNPTWSVFSGYSLEVRKDVLEQHAHLGVSAAF